MWEQINEWLTRVPDPTHLPEQRFHLEEYPGYSFVLYRCYVCEKYLKALTNEPDSPNGCPSCGEPPELLLTMRKIYYQ